MHGLANHAALFSRMPITCLKLLKVSMVAAGLFIIVLAGATYLLDLNLVTSYQWLTTAFGPLFLTIFTLLSGLGVYAIVQLKATSPEQKKPAVWYEVGQQAASGIATLALTFTLLGISLGIESLSRQALTPETVNTVIQGLTKHFSSAFMTTVVGLPTAHLIRSVLSVRWAAIQSS
jgi:hypothetical protein